MLVIYQAQAGTGQAGFETTAPSWEGFTASRLPHLRYVATDGDSDEELVWVAASAVSSHPMHAGVVEHSIYVHPGCQAHVIGRAAVCVHRPRRGRRHSDDPVGRLPGQRRQPEPAPALGLPMVGTRERIVRHHGVWRDVMLIERRSTVVGT